MRYRIQNISKGINNIPYSYRQKFHTTIKLYNCNIHAELFGCQFSFCELYELQLVDSGFSSDVFGHSSSGFPKFSVIIVCGSLHLFSPVTGRNFSDGNLEQVPVYEYSRISLGIIHHLDIPSFQSCLFHPLSWDHPAFGFWCPRQNKGWSHSCGKCLRLD